MFEMDDSKLGRLKVYNVTEARANFASVLREKEAKVVVTWHGRPFKVLVDYQEFSKLLQAQLENKNISNIPIEGLLQTGNDSLPPTQKLPGQWSEEDLTQIVKSITETLQNSK